MYVYVNVNIHSYLSISIDLSTNTYTAGWRIQISGFATNGTSMNIFS